MTTVPPYVLVWVITGVRTEVTFADVLAFEIVVPREVAVSLPLDELTAVNPFCEEARVYVLFQAIDAPVGLLVLFSVDVLEKVSMTAPFFVGSAYVAPAAMFAYETCVPVLDVVAVALTT